MRSSNGTHSIQSILSLLCALCIQWYIYGIHYTALDVFNLLFRCVNFIFWNSQLFVVRSIVEHFSNAIGGTIHCVYINTRTLAVFFFHFCFTINKINEIRAFVYTLCVCVYTELGALLPHGMVLIFSTTIRRIYITTTTGDRRESKILMEICAHIMII